MLGCIDSLEAIAESGVRRGTAEHAVTLAAAARKARTQIGAELYVSPGTVQTHLAHVYAKLGVANRTELALFAAEHSSP